MRQALLLGLLGVMSGFVQTRVSNESNAGWDAVASLWRIEGTDIRDVWPAAEAAQRVSRGQPMYATIPAEGASFTSAPLSALLYRPLAGLSPYDAVAWLFMVNRCLFAAIFVLLALLVRPTRASIFASIFASSFASSRRVAVLALALLLWQPLMRAIEHNQTTVLLTVLLGASLVAMQKGREIASGVVLALAVALHPALVLMVPLLYWHARRTLVSTLLSGLVLGLLSVVYAGWSAHVDYLTRVLPVLSSGYAYYPNQSWNGVVARLLHPELAAQFVIAPLGAAARMVSLCLGGLTLLYLALRIRALPRDAGLRVEVLGLAWLAATLAAPIAWEHQFTPAIFCLALLYRRLAALPPAIGETGNTAARTLALSAVLMASYFEVCGLRHAAALLTASYVFAGAALLSVVWLTALAGEASMRAYAERVRRLGRWLIPLPRAVEARLEAAGLVACVLLSLYLIAHLLLFEYGRDQGIYAVVARTMIDGGAPYRDTWDFKPPGIFFIYAVARLLFGRGMVGVRIVEAIGLLSLFPAFIVLCKRWVGSWRPALPAVALSVMAYVQLEFWSTAQPEGFAGFFLIWALVLCASERAILPNGGGAAQKVLWLTIGVAFGVAGVLKPQLAGAVVLTPFLLGHARASGSDRRFARLRASMGPLLFIALGTAVPIGCVATYIAAKGAMPAMVETLFGFVPSYTRLGHHAQGALALLAHAWDESLFGFSRHDAFGVLLAVSLPVLATRERLGLSHILAVAFFPVLGVALQAKFFPYHYAAVVPLLGLPAAWGFWKLWVRLRAHLLPVLALVGVLLLLKDDRILPPYRASFWARNRVRVQAVFADDERRQDLMDGLYSASDVSAGDNRKVASWIVRNTPADQPIYVWGFEPVIYDLAGRPSSTRYIYNVPQRVAWAGQYRPRLMADLTSHPPSVVVVEENDVFPFVTGDSLDSAQSLAGFPELQQFLLAHYRPGLGIGKLKLLVRQ